MSSDDERRALGFAELDGAAGPARPLSAAELYNLADRIVHRALAERPQSKARRPRRMQWLVAAAVLAVAGAATAAGALMVRTQSIRDQALRSREVVGQRERVPKAPRRARPVAQLPLPVEPEPPKESAMPPAAQSFKPANQTKSPPPAADLLREANRLRAQGRWQEAERSYAQVIRSRPGSSDSSVAALAAASLRLEHLGDPAGALRLYESVVHQGGLVEEALFGVARCHRALGNSALEIQTLRSLIARHPQPVIQEEAERRLSALGANASSP